MSTVSQTLTAPPSLTHLSSWLREHAAQRVDAAAAAYRKILALRPDVAEAYNNLGGVLKDQGQLDEAAAVPKRPSLSSPTFSGEVDLGDVFQAQGKLDQARGTLSAGDCPEARLRRGLQQPGHRAQRTRPARQRRPIRASVALKPDLFQAHHNLGNILAEQR